MSTPFPSPFEPLMYNNPIMIGLWIMKFPLRISMDNIYYGRYGLVHKPGTWLDYLLLLFLLKLNLHF